MKFFVLTAAMMMSLAAEARIQVLFHPHDPTLEAIAGCISDAKATVDIAMYNMDTTSGSPVIQTLQSPEIQKRIKSGDLRIRMVLELYGTPEENEKKRQVVEDLGIDVRFLGKAVKVHHKFAVIDAGGALDRVITGSANWSLSSYKNYNENILFFTQEHEVTSRYQFEFNRLWSASKEFGISKNYPEVAVPRAQDQADIEIYFNSPKTIDPSSNEPSNITEQIVRLIKGAKHDLQIATTRIRLQPVMEALLASAQRGVKTQIVISQDDFRQLGPRAKYLMNNPNIQLRIKFYNLNVGAYITYQMHNKFMIVDGETLFTGSFNWSDSSENGHIENVVVLKGAAAQQVLPSYKNEFADIWDMGRTEYAPLLQSLKQGQHPECAIPQMALTQPEIRQLLNYGSNCK